VSTRYFTSTTPERYEVVSRRVRARCSTPSGPNSAFPRPSKRGAHLDPELVDEGGPEEGRREATSAGEVDPAALTGLERETAVRVVLARDEAVDGRGDMINELLQLDLEWHAKTRALSLDFALPRETKRDKSRSRQRRVSQREEVMVRREARRGFV